MTLVAGVDIGNTTTEVVLAELGGAAPRPVAWDRRPTLGVKGSAEAAAGAARLVSSLMRRSGSVCSEVLLAPQAPVRIELVAFDRPAVATGPLVVLASDDATPGGAGFGVGRPVDCDAEPHGDRPVVLVARDPLGFRHTVDRVERWTDAGVPVVGVLLVGDEARLVAARIELAIPVVDGVDVEAALMCEVVACEVAAEGLLVRTLIDPLWLASALELHDDEHSFASTTAATVRGAAAGVVGLRRKASAATAESTNAGPAVTLADGSLLPLAEAIEVLRAAPVGHARSFGIGPGALDVGDLWPVSIDPAAWPALRARAVRRPGVVVALLDAGEPTEPTTAAEWPAPARVVASETAAALAGARTTPGARTDAAVLDVGGGTIDLITPGSSLTAAGAGELLTLAAAQLLGCPRGVAEWAKRGPAVRIEEPAVATDEAGRRTFLRPPAPAGLSGSLAVPGPAGLLPFGRDLALAEWRQLRTDLKATVIAANVARLLRELPVHGDLVLVGGPAGDDELVAILAATLGTGDLTLGRANVAGILGHRYAVAYGLTTKANW